MSKMENRVYGVVGIRSIMSNWNANFEGKPKTTSDGKIFGSDKAFKYPIKKMWDTEGKKVLYIKSYKKDDIQAQSLSERFEEIFGKKIKEVKEKEQIIKMLFSAIDVQNFGATFAEEGCNISITGCVQVGQGYNKYDKTNIEDIDILSPFRDSKKDDAKNTSIGSKIIVDEAHYMYPFTVNPSNYNIYTDIIEDLEGYTKEAYDEFKKGCLVAATAYNTNSKMGCENEFAIFIECKENSKLYLTNIDEHIKFEKSFEGKDIIDVTELTEIINKYKEEIDNVELYYNNYSLEIKGTNDNYKINNLY